MSERSVNKCGSTATKFSVATTRRWKDKQSDDWKEETNWPNVVVWQQEKLAQYLTKGKQVYVEGRLQTRSYDGKDGKEVYATEVIADDVILLGGQESGSGQQSSRPAAAPLRSKAAAPPADDDFAGMTITDDDIPF